MSMSRVPDSVESVFSYFSMESSCSFIFSIIYRPAAVCLRKPDSHIYGILSVNRWQPSIRVRQYTATRSFSGFRSWLHPGKESRFSPGAIGQAALVGQSGCSILLRIHAYGKLLSAFILLQPHNWHYVTTEYILSKTYCFLIQYIPSDHKNQVKHCPNNLYAPEVQFVYPCKSPEANRLILYWQFWLHSWGK